MTLKLQRSEKLLTLLALAIFGCDLTLPSERAFAVLFTLVVILAGRLLPSARHVAVTAALCAGLTIIGYFLRHGAGMEPDYLIRRLVALLAIGIVAVLTIRNQRLEQERREQAALLDLTGDATFVRNAAGIITSWSRGAQALYGWSSQQALGRLAGATIGPEDQDAAAAAHAALLRDGRWEGELVHRTRDRRPITVMSRWALQRDRRGMVQAVLETNTDITRSRIAEAEIRRSEERYRRIFHTTGAAIWEEDYAAVLPLLAALRDSGVTAFEPYFQAHPEAVLAALAKVRVVDVNQTAVEMFGAADKTDLLASLDRVFVPETLPSFAVLLAALAEGRPSCEAETTVRTIQGEIREIMMSVVFPRGEEPVTNVIVSIMDTTDRKRAVDALHRAQADLAQASRVATLGALTSSIAQAVDQPIAAIIAQGEAARQLLRRPQPDQAAVNDAITRVIEEGRRAAEIVSRVRQFLRKDAPLHADFDLRGAIEGAALLVQRDLLSHQVSLRLDLEAGLPPLAGDRARIEHVIVHLMVNGIHAMARTKGRPRELLVRTRRQCDTVIVHIQDTGCGFADRDMGRLFKPAFSTRDDGMRRDIGLAVCRASVEAHGGRIWTETAPGPGAIVQFALPLPQPPDRMAAPLLTAAS